MTTHAVTVAVDHWRYTHPYHQAWTVDRWTVRSADGRALVTRDTRAQVEAVSREMGWQIRGAEEGA